MRESLPRLLDTMAFAIDRQLLPHLTDDFARTQAYGLIYMLRCLRAQASWSMEFLTEQVEAADIVTTVFRDLLAQYDFSPPLAALDGDWRSASAARLEAVRDEAVRSLDEAYGWLQQCATELPSSAVDRLEEAYRTYLARQLKAELKRGVPINFSEISTGTTASRE